MADRSATEEGARVSEVVDSSGDLEASPRATSRWSRLVLRWRRLRSATPWRQVFLIALVGLLLGVVVGRGSVADPVPEAARAIDVSLLPLAMDADGIWTSASGDREAVSEAFVLLRREDDPSLVLDHHDQWLEAYDAMLVQLAGEGMEPAARPVQRHVIASVVLSRDAVEVLGHAATVEDAEHRQDLLTEVGRLRQRSEQLMQSARAALLDLDGQRADVAPLSPLTSFQEGRS
jgi:hypothetical protein